MKTVTVFHNIATDDKARHMAMLDGYQPGQPLVPVFRFGAPKDLDVDDLRICEHAFTLFNVGDDIDFGTPDPLTLQYREKGNRSMSVGDVVHVHNAYSSNPFSKWYACASRGFVEIEKPKWFAIGASTRGTTSLPVEDFDRS